MRSVAYLGPNGSYTHQAAIAYAQAHDASIVAQVTIKDVFDAVLGGAVTHGVVPIENSTNGSVTITFDLFRDLKHGNLKVCGEEFVQVRHALLGNCQLDKVERIYSHPQAFGQCERWLEKHLKGVERINVSSTSRAARMLKDDPNATAISSRICADLYNTSVIAQDIQDSSENTTRFFVLSARSSPSSNSSRTFLRFMVDHTQPGALCDALQAFKHYDLNLTSIVSRPAVAADRLWTYVFFVEFEGHEEDQPVQKAVVEVRSIVRELRVLGSYETHRSITDRS